MTSNIDQVNILEKGNEIRKEKKNLISEKAKIYLNLGNNSENKFEFSPNLFKIGISKLMKNDDLKVEIN